MRRRSMETEEHLHVIGMGSEADWDAGRGSFYYIEDKNGEKCIPVFTSPERADRFAQASTISRIKTARSASPCSRRRSGRIGSRRLTSIIQRPTCKCLKASALSTRRR
jgi:hypothetical protein